MKKVSIFLAYIKKKQYLCARFEKNHQSSIINHQLSDQRNHIIKTAGELFFRLGIRSVSIDDICRELGMSKKTFYVYFESKDELIEQMLQANISYMSGKMQELLDLRDFRQLVKKFIKHQEAEKNDVRRVPQLVYDLKKYYPRQFADFQVKCFETQKTYIMRYLELGVAQGLVRANLNIELTAVLFAKIHNDAIRDFEEIEAHNHNMHQLAHTAMDVFVRGVLSEEGLKFFQSN
ncbi:MAG: TetR/AcrR family transcriptional regulator [Paludibacteraceae bacterium]|nr:TetR/AcrR family transcriptional regulator [Paludibacteraceae bacterium]